MAGKRCVPSETEFNTLMKDRAFVDFFNVFLNQPVFGQRVIYRHRTEEFVLDPPIQKKRYKVFDIEVRDWLRTQRFPVFAQTDLFVEYNLCCRLRDTKDGFLQDVNGDLQSNNEFWEKTTDFLLGQVLGMQQFRYSLHDTPGDTAFACWMDLEKFRRLPMSDPERVTSYQHIKDTYLVNGAPRELTKIAKHQAFRGAMSFSLLSDEIFVEGSEFLRHLFHSHTLGAEGMAAFSENTFSRLQALMLVVLKSYWLPRYILHILKTVPKSLMRKYIKRCEIKSEDGFFCNNTKQRIRTMFPDSLEDESLSPSPVDLITYVVEDYSSDEESDVEPSELFLLWGGQRFHEANLFPTYESLTSGRVSDVSSKSRDGSLWTPPVTDSTALSPRFMAGVVTDQRLSSDTSLPDSKHTARAKRFHKRKSNKVPVRQTRSVDAVTDGSKLSVTVRHFIRGPMYTTQSTFEQQNPRLTAAIVSDALSGKPLAEHLRKSCAFGSQMYLMMWSDLQEYMTVNIKTTDGVGRNRKQLLGVNILRRYFLKTPTKNTATLYLGDVQDDLYTSLLYGTESDALIKTMEICCKALKLAWQEFTAADRHNFVHKVIRHGLRKLSANKRCVSMEPKEVSPCDDFDHQAIWRALELAVIMSKPLGLKPENDIKDMSLMIAQGFGSLSKSPQRTVHNAALRELVFPRKLDINEMRVTREFLYRRPEIPGDKVMDKGGFQIKKNGVVIDRPPKPRCFPEILTNPIHFEFFKRFLLMKRATMPLMFWKQVQELKETKSPRQRVSKVTQIFRRYFSKNANYGAQLDCADDIIKQITLMERVTASMIVCAQGAVMRTLERKWFKAYLETYPFDDNRSPLPSPSPEHKMFDIELSWSPKRPPTKLQTYALWVKFLRIITLFNGSLKDRRRVMLVWVYLKLQVKKALEKKSSATTEVKIVLHNRLVIVNKLPQDLLFWVEVSKYTELLDDACKPGLLFNVSKVDEDNLRVKATAIVNCFLASDIPPKLQINVTPETAANVIALLGVRGPTRSLFHECIMSIFPVIYHYFTHCWDEWGIRKKTTNIETVYAEKTMELRGSLYTDSPHGSEIFPSYNHIHPRNIKRVIGPRGEDCVRINFTIATGLRMIIPTEGNRNRTVMESRRNYSAISTTASGSKHSARLKDRSSKETSGLRAHSKKGSLARINSTETNKQTLHSPSKVLAVKETEGESINSPTVSPTL